MNDIIRVNEVFLSFEGEGPYAGRKTLFVRLAGCPLSCYWCDTDYALSFDAGTVYDVFNFAEELVEKIKATNPYKVNFTGGEPLAQFSALQILLPIIKSQQPTRIYLESSCYNSYYVKELLKYIDIMKVEFKLKSSKASRNMDKLQEQELKSLEYTLERPVNYYIKIVITGDEGEFEELTDLYKRIAEITAKDTIELSLIKRFRGLYLQPEYNSITNNRLSKDLLLKYYDQASMYFNDVFVLPQIHKILNVE